MEAIYNLRFLIYETILKKANGQKPIANGPQDGLLVKF